MTPDEAYKSNFKLIDWSVPIVTAKPPRPRGARSDTVSCPHFIKDHLDELVGQHDGKVYTSKSALRQSYRVGGFEEVGTEAQEAIPASARRPKFNKDEVGQALQKIRAGYRPDPLPSSVLPEDDE